MRFQSNYDLFPHIHVETDKTAYAREGWDAIGQELIGAVRSRDTEKTVLCVDCYHGVWEQETLERLRALLRPDAVFRVGDAQISREKRWICCAGILRTTGCSG